MIHAYIHVEESVSLAPYRLGSNLRSRSRESREEMLTGLKREEALRYGPI